MNALFSPEAAFLLMFVFFAAHSILDGYALGIGCLVPFVREKPEADRLVSHIAPFWDANEVWLVMGIGFVFAAFPLAFAIVISTFYLPFMIVLGALTLRAVALEFSYHDPARVRFWRNLLGVGSFLAVFVSVVALGFVLRGLHFTGIETIGSDISDAFSALPLLFGFSGVVFLVWHGILHARDASAPNPISRPANLIWLLALGLTVASAWAWLTSMPFLRSKPCFWLGGVVCFGGLIASRMLVGKGRWAFRASSAAIIGLWIAVAASLFPNLLVSADHPAWTISIRQAAAPVSSLRVVMVASPILIVAIVCYGHFIQRIIRRQVVP